MTRGPQNLVEDSIKSRKSSLWNPQKTKGMSFLVFLLSLFVYGGVFYIFNISPSAVFNTPKFWFFLSNTLILIIAADYGAFSSSEEKQDMREEFVMHSRVKTVPQSVSEYPEVTKEMTDKIEVDDSQEKKVIYVASPESNLQVVVKNDNRKASHHENLQEKRQVPAPEAAKVHARTYRRSKSEKAKRVVIDESKNIIRRSETVKLEPSADENEFSTMSDEELNRRFEEFIQQFNRQIRLQGASKLDQT